MFDVLSKGPRRPVANSQIEIEAGQPQITQIAEFSVGTIND
jgi:hypothetical protein